MTRGLAIVNPEAADWAQSFFAVLRTARDPWIGVRWLDVAGNRRAFVDIIKALAELHPLNMIATVAEAHAGWDIADEALREIFAEHVERRQEIPTSLAAYMQKVALGYRPKIASTQRSHRWLRNIAIAHAIDVLVSRYGLPARGYKGSACAVVAKAMRGQGGQILTAKAVEKVWKDYEPWIARFTKLRHHLQEFTEKKPAP
jgi:hypothetical protein